MVIAESNNRLQKLKEALRARALALGFDCAAFAPPTPPPHSDRLLYWLTSGAQGEMAWMARNTDRRTDPRLLMPGLGAILTLGVNYRPQGDPLAFLHDPGAAAFPAFAHNNDYHDELKKRAKPLFSWLETQIGHPLTGRIFVDTAPVLEKPLAAAAGLGWQGKNTLLVSRRFGCWLLLAELFLPLPLTPDPPVKDHCGACRRCLDACPTDALSQPYWLDASRCLSYHTIESPLPIPLKYRAAMGNRVFGCDDCVAVCPWNRFALPTGDAFFHPRPQLTNPQLLDFVHLDDAAFRTLFRKSPVKRTGVSRFLRNVAVALGNWAAPAALPALVHLLNHETPLVRGHAAWGVGQLSARNPPGFFGSDPETILAEKARKEPDHRVQEEIENACAAYGKHEIK